MDPKWSYFGSCLITDKILGCATHNTHARGGQSQGTLATTFSKPPLVSIQAPIVSSSWLFLWDHYTNVIYTYNVSSRSDVVYNRARFYITCIESRNDWLRQNTFEYIRIQLGENDFIFPWFQCTTTIIGHLVTFYGWSPSKCLIWRIYLST